MKYIHIVAFDMPDPPDYGGVIDIYYKIKSLHACGVNVILHVFLYDGKEPSAALEKICHSIYYYNRRRFKNPFMGDLPYIVATRDSDDLLVNLKKDKHPILFEGLHTTHFLPHPDLKDRFKIVRTHNVEHLYYKALEDAESSYFKKYFFRVEAERLEAYENVLQHANLIAAISPEETAYYASKFSNTKYLPAFHSNDGLNVLAGKGRFILYHGNLGVGENNKAALYLVHEVFSKLQIPCVIAGNNPGKQLQQAVKGNPYISLIGKINSDDILQLVQEAHANILVTFQSTGIKLKLLNSLYRGRYCVVNNAMVENTGLETACIVAQNATEMIEKINGIWDTDFSEDVIQSRKELLDNNFDNLKNAELLKSFI